MIYFLQKIKHYLTANSRHGTHSPFVYTLADELIYNKNINRSDSLMEDIITYYESKGIGREAFLVTDFNTHSVEDLVHLQDVYFIIFVKKIYRNANHKKYWKAMQRHKDLVVLIDMFEFGIICKRKEQLKENFKLRYPYFLY